MSVINVKKNIFYNNIILSSVAEVATDSENRSFVYFNDANEHIKMEDTKFERKFVTPFNYLENKDKKDFYQKDYVIKLATTEKDDFIYLSRRGTRPALSKSASVNKLFNNIGEYTFSYNSLSDVTEIKKPDGNVETIDKTVFNLIVGGAGGGGRGSSYFVQYYVLWARQFISLGAPGGSGSIYHCLVDMRKINSFSIKVGQGGSGSSGNSSASDGVETVIKIKGREIKIPAGKKGSQLAHADVSSVDWDFSFIYDNENGEGGKIFSSFDIDGLFINKTVAGQKGKSSSRLLYFTDKYEVADSSLRYNCQNYGGAGGSLPPKPSFGLGDKKEKTNGQDGKNGFIQIIY